MTLNAYDCDVCEKKLEIQRLNYLRDYYKNIVKEGENYTKIISTLGYTILLSVFMQFNSFLPLNLKKIFIVMYSLSLSFFIINEIFNMVVGQKSTYLIYSILSARPKSFEKKLLAYEILMGKKRKYFMYFG